MKEKFPKQKKITISLVKKFVKPSLLILTRKMFALYFYEQKEGDLPERPSENCVIFSGEQFDVDGHMRIFSTAISI